MTKTPNSNLISLVDFVVHYIKLSLLMSLLWWLFGLGMSGQSSPDLALGFGFATTALTFAWFWIVREL